MNTTLKKTIMRRVYYAYVLAIALHPLTLHIAALTFAGYLLARLVHVAVIYQGFLNVRLGDLGPYALTVIRYADGATLAVATLAVMIGLSLLWRMRNIVLPAPESSPMGYA